MKFKINREVFLLPLQKIVNVIEKRQTMPILSNILLKMNAEVLTLTGSDLEIQLIVELSIDNTEVSEITVPARKILDIIRLLPAESQIDIQLDNAKLKIVSGRSRFSLTTLEAVNYPEFDEKNPHTTMLLPISQLNKALNKTLFCMANQDVRYYLNGILVTISNQQLKLVASDGHRLALFNEPLTEANDIETSFIIPRKGVIELSRLLSDSDQLLSLQLAISHVRLDFERLSFSVKLIDAKYPDFSKVFQQDFKSVIPVNRKDFKDALTRVSILSNEKFKGVSLNFSDSTLKVAAYNPDHEEAEENVTIDYSGEAFVIAFNAQYLLDAVSNLESDLIHISLSSNMSACVIEDPMDASYQYIVMPMRL
ncbi:MAG TPA: DNA polymerase III subunit beta [Methylococcaceae bacterium]|jgi:DNA polymerase-3 subunit beta|nr:DNA polymerase III subunit beta [Methylococcaceae bacterium]HIN68164.1 DNA polymerase III subunit beta [Methylococcales bacterium]HIA45921.1 DNA polymerase III subunit beta [Methylococcaceae bacterium]HIB62192.1 DNA polymerase III subunit beta [Methylococcaceae bacterium]HIO12175.1 DNA polymerase III subunit beta [Methylococcales bacterium]